MNDRIFGTVQQQAEAAELDVKEGEATTIAERSKVDFLQWRMQDELVLEKLSDQSIFIRDAVKDVQSAAYLGALFAVGVIWMTAFSVYFLYLRFFA